MSNELDIAWILDTTGSMSAHINGCKNYIIDTMTLLMDSVPALQVVRLSFVGYKDYGDSGHMDFIDFRQMNRGETLPAEFVEVVSRQSASGGGDTPEDVAAGYQQAASLNWASYHRYVVHIADAPPHGTKYCDATYGDSYPGDSYKMDNAISSLQAKDVKLILLIINDPITKKLQNELSTIFADRFIPLPNSSDIKKVFRDVIGVAVKLGIQKALADELDSVMSKDKPQEKLQAAFVLHDKIVAIEREIQDGVSVCTQTINGAVLDVENARTKGELDEISEKLLDTRDTLNEYFDTIVKAKHDISLELRKLERHEETIKNYTRHMNRIGTGPAVDLIQNKINDLKAKNKEIEDKVKDLVRSLGITHNMLTDAKIRIDDADEVLFSKYAHLITI